MTATTQATTMTTATSSTHLAVCECGWAAHGDRGSAIVAARQHQATADCGHESVEIRALSAPRL